MEKFNHIELNNEVTKRGDNGFFKLEKDVEAIEEFSSWSRLSHSKIQFGN